MPRVYMPIFNAIKMPMHLNFLVNQRLINIEVPPLDKKDDYDSNDVLKPKYIRIVFLNDNIKLRNLVYDVFDLAAYAEKSHENNGTRSNEIYLSDYSSFRKNAKNSKKIPKNYLKEHPTIKKMSADFIYNKIYTDKLELLRKKYFDVAMLVMGDFIKNYGKQIKEFHKKNYVLNSPLKEDSIFQISETLQIHQIEINNIVMALRYNLKQEMVSPGEISKSETVLKPNEEKENLNNDSPVISNSPSSKANSSPVYTPPVVHDEKIDMMLPIPEQSRQEGEHSTTAIDSRLAIMPISLVNDDALVNPDESDDDNELQQQLALDNPGIIPYTTSTDIEGKAKGSDNDEKEEVIHNASSSPLNTQPNPIDPATMYSSELIAFIKLCVTHNFPADVLSVNSLKCRLSHDVCHIPVMVNDMLFDLRVLTSNIENFGKLVQFQNPITTEIATKKDILPAPQVLEKTIEFFNDWESRLATEGEEPTEPDHRHHHRHPSDDSQLQSALATQAMQARSKLKKINVSALPAQQVLSDSRLSLFSDGVVTPQHESPLPVVEIGSGSPRVFPKSPAVAPAPITSAIPVAESVSAAPAVAVKSQDEEKLFVNEFIKKHSEVFHQKSFFTRRSKFLKLQRQGRIHSVKDIIDFVIKNPKSRTAAVLTTMETVPASPWASYVKKYIAAYNSKSRFFKSASLRKIQSGEIDSIEKVKEYANLHPTSLTAQTFNKS